MKEEGKEEAKRREIEEVRRQEQAPLRRYLDRDATQLRRRLERNAGDLLTLDLEDFLRVLREDYKLNETQLAQAKQIWIELHEG